ncbi:calmodulin-like protein, partial [Pavlovales sp. CCMP2436]
MSLIREYESKLPPELLAKYRRTFDQFDRDGGGDVDVRELGVMFRALRQFPQERELERMVSDVDDDGSGTIDFNEFCGLMLRLSRS